MVGHKKKRNNRKEIRLLREKPLPLNRIQYAGAYFYGNEKMIMPFEGENLRESRHF